MGYYVTLEYSTAVIPAENKDEALRRWKELNKKDDLKRGGSWGPDGKTEKWFSWMPPDFDTEPGITVEKILDYLGFTIAVNDNGDISIKYYDSKTGQEGLFFEAIADLLSEESEMIWRGEDGNKYRWTFEDGKLREGSGIIIWS